MGAEALTPITPSTTTEEVIDSTSSKDVCTSCGRLKEENANFLLNGVTPSVCESLGNGTGFKADNEHTNCQDLQDANDCLIWGLLDKLPAYGNCDWKEFVKALGSNQATINDALLCWLCGLENRVFGQNIGVELRFQVLDGGGDPTMTMAIDKQGDWTINETDWIEQITNPYGYRTVTGHVDFCMSVLDNMKAGYIVKSVTLGHYTYDATGNPGAVTIPSMSIRVPDENGEVIYQKTHEQGVDYDEDINRTVELNYEGEIEAGETSDWITFMNFYADWVIDSSVNIQIRFINGNTGSVPMCSEV